MIDCLAHPRLLAPASLPRPLPHKTSTQRNFSHYRI